MREVHRIPRGMVQPWMIGGCLAELLLGSFALPTVAFMFLKWWPVMLAIPFLIVVSYLVTAKDIFRMSVVYSSAGTPAKPRSLKKWGGAKTYAPR
ncbi:VirB3 family type IV secretion system protein [Paraburkholderia ginsengisoli]|uniref:VirB3 family type IV secretion system protein n=1 Tax=Paraburkholderia ginsengisoli TaxID=311231 RepID=A0A7T4TC43_9BURK|nr:VirB3 family type IV secretion system protein [Paraburkholderia ginsengisoli]QQC67862.1 VirB3 family type IV secretion system protein [Paraburkholderia ginsengisoli]